MPILTQKTCSTAGPLCIISPNAISWAEVPLSLPIPITQHTPGPVFVQCLVIHTGAVGEEERAKGKKEPRAGILGAFELWGETEIDSRGGAKLVTTSCEEDCTVRLHLVILMARHDLQRLRDRVG
jgi:hypothetical protein